MKLSKVAFAVAGLMAIAGAAHAGQIGSSSTTLALEVIKSDAQVVLAPSKAYNFAGDIDARTNGQQLQLQYTLDKGQWPVGTGTRFPTADTLVDLTTSGVLAVAYNDAAGNSQTTLPAGSLVQGFVTADRKTLAFNISIPSGAAADAFLLKTPIFTLNALNSTAALNVGNTGITGLLSVAGEAACTAPDSSMDISFKHFTSHNGQAQLQTNASPDSEHLRPNATNQARLLSFTQNLAFQFAGAPRASQTDANTVNKTLQLAGGVGNWSGVESAPGVALVALTGATPNLLHYIGKVNLQQKGTGFDTNYTNHYGDSVTPFDPAAPFIAGDFSYLASPSTATLNSGVIEFAAFEVTLTLPTAWPAGTVITAANGAGAALTDVLPVTLAAGATEVTLKATSAAGAAALANGAYLWATFNGTTAIPQTSGVAAKASLLKAPAGTAGDFSEQNNICAGSLTGIGGGIKIDVRNYATFATYGTTGPRSLVRIINNSESQAADVYGQIIYGNGMYGPWGKLGELAPRAAQNLTNDQIEALLTNAAAASNPFGASTVYTSDTNAQTQGNMGGADNADRLRIVSNTGSTLRVQSFIAYPSGIVLDTSNAQGVDFENEANNRTPSTAIDGQPISQDAINGLGR